MQVIRESRSGGVNLGKAGEYQHRGEGRDGGKGGVEGGGVVGTNCLGRCHPPSGKREIGDHDLSVVS